LKIAASYDAAMAGATRQLGLGLAINGVFDPDTECRATTGLAGNIAKLNTAWIIDLPDGQEVAMRVANFTNADAIQFQRGRIVATSVAGFGPQGPQGPVGPIGPVGGVDSVNSQTGVVVLTASDVGAYPDTNPSSFVDAAGASAAAPVQSVNTFTGAVVLGATDVGAYPDTNPSNFIDAAGAPVQSVNTQTGAVVLSATDVGAYPDTNPSSFVDAAGAAAAAPVQSVDSLTGAVDLVPRYAVASDTAPVSPFVGQRWVQTSTGRLAYWTGSEWVEIGALGLDLSVAAADPAFTGAFLPLGAIPTGGTTGQVLAKVSATNYDTEWFSGPQLGWPRNNRFQYITQTPQSFGGATTAFTLDRLYLTPIWLVRAETIVGIQSRIIGSATVGSTFRFGFYSANANGEPDTLLLDAGTIDASTTGFKGITGLNLSLAAGLHWAAFVVQGAGGPTTYGWGGPTFQRSTQTSTFVHGNRFHYGISGVAGALDATVTVVNPEAGTGPHFALERA
jgi:hypothetical protein